MTQVDYTMLLLEGWLNDTTGHLADYFYRELKRLEKADYSLEETYANLQGIIKRLKNDTEKHYYEQLHLWYQYNDQQKEKGLPVNMNEPQIENSRQSIPLIFLTESMLVILVLKILNI
jgi:hypothetical protein